MANIIHITDTNEYTQLESTNNIPESGTLILPISGGFTLINSSDYQLVAGLQWFADRDGYATTFVKEPFRSLRLHHLILPRLPNMVTDHINCVRLDNRRTNLNYTTMRGNHRNYQVKGTDIMYTQEQLLQRTANYEVFKAYRELIKL